jgi:hypothetical protein
MPAPKPAAVAASSERRLKEAMDKPGLNESPAVLRQRTAGH